MFMATERMKFVEFWARYVRSRPDKDWSRQQKVVIDGQLPSSMTKEEYFRMRGSRKS